MFPHIKKCSSALKASPLEMLHQLRAKNNVVNQSFLEESKKQEGLLDQISLRPFKITDVDDIMVWATDDQVSRYCGGAKIYRSQKEALKDIQKVMIPHPWFRAICLENRPIGKIFVYPYDDDNPCVAELGYVVAPKHWGKGIATTAVKMVLDTVFKEWPHLERLDALVDVENLGSLRVLEKSGFLKEGVLRKFYSQKGRSVDMAMFSFLSTDFKLG